MDIMEVIRSGDYWVLDTETTGLGSDAEICQIAIIDAQGNTLLDTLVQPRLAMSPEVIAIHGIDNGMVKDAPLFTTLEQQIYGLLKDRHVIIYNASYDVRMLNQSNPTRTGVTDDWNRVAKYWCAMETFAAIYGDWNPRYSSYKWKSLDVACGYYKVENIGAHSALGDCLATLAVCKAMAASEAAK